MTGLPHSALSSRDLVAEREKIIARLSDAFAHDDLDMDEFERRLTLVHERNSMESLHELVADLPQAKVQVHAQTLARSSHPPEHQEIIAIFGGHQIAGPRPLPRRLKIKTVFGGVMLDLREALFPDGVVDVEIKAVFGGVQIIVPPTLAVECHGVAIFGGFEGLSRSPANPDPASPLLRVRGQVVFGGVQIETRLPGEGLGGHHHRHREERLALHEARRALRATAKAERRKVRGLKHRDS
jgi:hypothetical protein